MTHILVTNDDGVHAPGISALAEAMTIFGDVEIAAPATNQSASGHKKTLYTDIKTEVLTLPNGIEALAVGGSPADCIALSAMGMRTWPPRLVVSGINRGENLAQDLTYSGTVTAALEAVIHGVPAIAFSLSNHFADDPADYEQATKVAQKLVPYVLEHGLPPFTILNVNIPNTEIKGMRLVRQGVRIFRDALDIDGDTVQIVGEPPTGVLDTMGTDIWAIHNGYVSITPVHLDMTAHEFMSDLVAWNIEL